MNQSWFGSSVVPFRLVFLMWAAFYVEFLYGWPLSFFGIIPWTPVGLIGIFTAPMLHGSLNHLISNTIPLLFLSTTTIEISIERKSRLKIPKNIKKNANPYTTPLAPM